MKKVNNEEKEGIEFLRDLSKAKTKGKVGSPDLTAEKNIDIEFGALMFAKRKSLSLSRPQLAKLLKISPSTVKRIENGETTVRKNRELIDCICRDLKLNLVMIYHNFGINTADKKWEEIERIKINKAKNNFVDALQNSHNYFNYFVRMFHIAQSYKTRFSKQSDYEIDRALDDVELMASLNKLLDSKYAEFFLEQIYKLAPENKSRKVAKTFFSSRMANAFSVEDWQTVLNGAEPKLLKNIYDALLEIDETGEFKDEPINEKRQ